MSRLGIYAFYDKEGVIDDFVYYFLEKLKEISNRVIFVSNGPIQQKYINKLQKITNEILIRENTGLDVYAYKHAFNYVGFDNLKNYYEVILCNSTFFGPVYELKEMFDEMDKNNDLDFWGITQHPDYYEDTDSIPAFNINPYGYIPKHIQSYFVVYRNKFLNCKQLYDYWNNIPKIKTYAEAVGLAETVFTKYFEDLGFNWDTYIKYSDGGGLFYPLLYKPYDVLTKYKCPIIKRKSFFIKNKISDYNSSNEQAERVIKYLEVNNLYDVNLIKSYLSRTQEQNKNCIW